MIPSRNPYGCVFWPTYLLSFFFLDFAAFFAFVGLRLFAPALTGGAVASALDPAFVDAVFGARDSASPSTWISTWLVRFLIGVARPIAAGVKRLRVGPSFTTAYLTRSWSTSSAVFSRSARCSAFATADLSTLWICFAANFFENRRMAYAWGTTCPRIWSITRRIFRADWRTVRWIARASMGYDGLGGASAAPAAASSRSCAEPLAEWPRNSRVAANSPSLCPTIFSVMYTGMNLFPLCTASVWPTKSGVMVERRDQVLNTFFSFFSFRAVIFTRSDGST